MFSVRSTRLSIAFAALLAGITHARAADDAAARTAIIARFQSIQSISVRFQTHAVFSPDPRLVAALPESSRQARWNRQDDFLEKYRFLDGAYLGETTMIPATIATYVAAGEPAKVYCAWGCSHGRVEQLLRSSGSKTCVGAIDRSGKVPDLWTIDLALGLRPYRRLEPFSTDEVRKLALGWNEKGSLVAQYNDEGHNVHRWYFSPAQGYALVDYTVSLPDGTLFEDIEPSEFTIYGNVALPAKVVRRSIYYDERGNAKPMKTIELTQIKFDMNDPENTDEGLYLKWPKGSLIGDRRTDAQLVVREKDQRMDDATIEAYLRKAATRPTITPPPSRD